MLETGDKLKIDQEQLETVLPQVGGLVRIVRGKYKGESAKLLKIDEAKFSAQVIVESGLSKGLTLWQEYEDICKIHVK